MAVRKSTLSSAVGPRDPLDWLTADQAADMLNISVKTFLRRVEDGTLPAPSTVLGERNPRWNVKNLFNAMAGIKTNAPVTSEDISARIAEIA